MIRNNLPYLFAVFIGIILWLAVSATLGDAYAVAIGPDFIIRLGAKIFWLGVAVIATRWIIRLRFPTIHEFTRQGDKPESAFSAAWRHPGLIPEQHARLSMAVAVHLGVFLAICVLISFS